MTRLRPYVEGDAEAFASIYERAVRAIGPRDYSPAQIEAWVGQGPGPERFRARMGDGRRCWVALGADGRTVGFVDLEADGHIDFLYVAPDVAGGGVAAALLDALEVTAAEAGILRLYVEASEAARRFFLKRGFTVLGRRDFEVGGTAIHNYAMERRL